MKKSFLIAILGLLNRQAFSQIDSLYNSKWKVGLKISIVEVPVKSEDGVAGHLWGSIPVTRNINHSFFNLESGISGGGFFPNKKHTENQYEIWKGYDLGLPLKIKYDRDGAFLSSGFITSYSHYQYSGLDFCGDPYSFKVDGYFLKLNCTMGFEKHLGYGCEMLVDVFYERTLLASSGSSHIIYDSNSLNNIGFSLGFLIRGN